MLYKLLSRMDRRRFDCRVVSLTDFGTVGPEIKDLGIDVVALNFQKIYSIIPGFLVLLSIFLKWKPDIVSTWLYHSDLIAGVAAKLSRVPRIVWNIRNTTLVDSGRFGLTKFTVKFCAMLSNFIPDKIITNSICAIKFHSDLGYTPNKIELMPNGFDLELFKPDEKSKFIIRAKYKIPIDCVVIGLFGRYDKQKNHSGFIQAASVVLSKYPSTILLLVGRGINSSNAYLTQLIHLSGWEKNFILADEQSDMPSFCASLDWLCLPSLGESFPNVLGEAMSSAIPCIVSDVGDCADIVGETGIVFPPNDTESLIGALDLAIGKTKIEREMLGHNARLRIIEKYSIASVVDKYESFFLRVMENKQSCAVS